jgi:hypothetical protein
MILLIEGPEAFLLKNGALGRSVFVWTEAMRVVVCMWTGGDVVCQSKSIKNLKTSRSV